MINRVFRLTAPRKIELQFIDETLNDDAVYVKPTHLAICAADQRYYMGLRPKEVLDKKLPMALIHEAIGEVILDKKGEFKKGDKVVMIPNTPTTTHDVFKENYLPNTKFRSSGYDGFMQSVVPMRRDRVILLPGDVNEDVAALLEVISVPFSMITDFHIISHKIKETIGIWGDGSIGFTTALTIHKAYPEAKIYVVGKDPEKMNYFSFVDATYDADNLPKGFKVDHAFECVGGKYAGQAINQIIDVIAPQGTIAILGVSEDPPAINTRMILEKGLRMIGSSRSGYDDFQQAVNLIKDKEVQNYLSTIISEIVDVKKIEDMNHAFEADAINKFKTVMRWKV